MWFPADLTNGVVTTRHPGVISPTELVSARGAMLKPGDLVQIHRDRGLLRSPGSVAGIALQYMGIEADASSPKSYLMVLFLNDTITTPLAGDNTLPKTSNPLFKMSVRIYEAGAPVVPNATDVWDFYYESWPGRISIWPKPVFDRNVYYVSGTHRVTKSFSYVVPRGGFITQQDEWVDTEGDNQRPVAAALGNTIKFGLGIPITANDIIRSEINFPDAPLDLWGNPLNPPDGGIWYDFAGSVPIGGDDFPVETYFAYWITFYSESTGMESRAMDIRVLYTGATASNRLAYMDLQRYGSSSAYSRVRTADVVGYAPGSSLLPSVSGIRIYRHRCIDRTEAIHYLARRAPLVGGLVATLTTADVDALSPVSWLAGSRIWYDRTGTSDDLSTPYALIVRDIGGQLLIYERNVPKKPFSVGTMFNNSLVTNSPSEGTNVVRFTPVKQPWYNPDPYWFALTSEGDDEILAFVPLDNALMVLTTGGIWRINYLPMLNDGFGQPQQEKISTIGCLGRAGWITIPSDQGTMLLFMSQAGLMMCNGRAVTNACDDFTLASTQTLDLSTGDLQFCTLVHDVPNARIRAYLAYEAYDFYYHPTHLKPGGFKVMGPTAELGAEADLQFTIDSTHGIINGVHHSWVMNFNTGVLCLWKGDPRDLDVQMGTITGDSPLTGKLLRHVGLVVPGDGGNIEVLVERQLRGEPFIPGTLMSERSTPVEGIVVQAVSDMRFNTARVRVKASTSVGPLYLNIEEQRDGIG